MASLPQHKVPVDAFFETGDGDDVILAGDHKEVVSGKLMQLLAKYSKKEISAMLNAANRSGPNDDSKVLSSSGLTDRITKSFNWAAQQHGLPVESFRVAFNVAATANGKPSSIDFVAAKAAREEKEAARELFERIEACPSDDED